jgi:membrane-associated phospholipid phosphatase
MPPFFMPAAHMPALGKQLVAGTLVSGAIFLLLPAELGFPRVLPADPDYAKVYAAMFDIDRPHNLVPSLHAVFTLAIGLACADDAKPFARWILLAWTATIVASTVFVHQHHLLDVAAAIALVCLLRLRYKVPHA